MTSVIVYESQLFGLLLLFIPLLFILYFFLLKKRQERVELYMKGEGQRPVRRRRFFWPKVSALVLALVMAVMALMQPAKTVAPKKIERAAVDEVAFLMDVSASMGVQDVTPSSGGKQDRFSRAKEIMQQVVEAIAGFNVSLYTFQTDAIEEVPSTFDYLYFGLTLKNLPICSTSIPGTNFSNLFTLLKKNFLDTKVRKKVHFVLLTDGEDTSLFGVSKEKQEERHEEELQRLHQLQEAGFSMSIVGIGTVEGGPVPGLHDVTSSFHPEEIALFQRGIKGRFYDSRNIDLQDIVDGIVAELRPEEKETSNNTKPLFLLPLLLAILFLLIHLFIPDEVKYV